MLGLAEAIRLGAMIRPQAFYRMYTTTGDGFNEIKASCAMGAAYEAGYSVPTFVCNTFASCPEGCGHSAGFEIPLEDVVIHLNDAHRWTRERIADWVDTVIPQGAPDATTVAVAAL